MFCGKCGNEIKEGSKFCPVCGAPAYAAAAAAAPAAPVVPAAPVQKKAAKLVPIIAAGAALVLVIVLVLSLFGGASAKVGKALLKSGEEFVAVAEELGLTGVDDLVKDKKISQSVTLRLDDTGMDVDGLGVRMNVDVTVPGKKIGVSMTPFIGSADIASVQAKLDNSKFYVGSPELTKGSFFMVNTETIGKDLAELTGAEEMEDITFNLFKLIDQLEEAAEGNEKLTKDTKKALTKFAKTIEVEKEKKQTIEVNDHDLKCQAYSVTLTEDGMVELVEALEEAYSKANNTDAYVDIVKSIGLPDYVAEEVEYSLENVDIGETFDDIRDTVKDIGDIELDVYINGGYIVAAVYEEDDQTLTVNIGGGKNYVDDISIRMEGDNYETAIVSSGNHSCSGGKFTDETEITEKYGSNKSTLAKFEIEYDLKAKDDNFKVTLVADGDRMEAEGYAKFGKNAVELRLDELEIDGVTVGIEYKLEGYAGDNIKVKKTLDVAKMSEDDLMEEVEAIGENVEELLGSLAEEYPDLSYLMYGLF